MIWYLCFAAAVLLLVLGAVTAVFGKNGDRRIGLILIFLFCATYIAYYPLVAAEYDAGTAFLGDLLRTLRVITLDADFLEYYDLVLTSVGIAVFAKAYLTLLGILHVLLPIVSVLGVYSILVRYFAGVQLRIINRRKRPLYVFSAYNTASQTMADSIRVSVPKCDIVFACCAERPDGKSRKNRCSFQSAEIDALKINHKKGRQITYLCCAEDDDRNLNDALQLLDASALRSKECQQSTHVLLFSEQENTDILVDSAEKASTDVRVIRKSEQIAYRLLNEHPLYDAARDNVISVLLVGLSEVNAALFKAVSWCGQLGGCRLRIHVAGIGIGTQIDLLKSRVPALCGGWHDVHFYDCETETALEACLCEHCTDAGYICISEGGDGENISRAVRLRRLYYSLDGTYQNAPQIYVHTRSEEKKGVVAALCTSETKAERRVSYGLIPFGSDAEIYNYRDLIDTDSETLSRNVHLVYTDIFSDGEIDVPDALEKYNLFEVNKRSNRANAMHIRCKLALLGLDYTDDPAAEEVCPEEYFTEEKLQKLAVAEHDRWMAFLESEGWSGSTVPQAEAYKASGLSRGRHNCSLLQLHPYICPYDELPARSEALGLPDSTVYDIELIRRIPDILHDRWNISKRKYKIIRK